MNPLRSMRSISTMLAGSASTQAFTKTSTIGAVGILATFGIGYFALNGDEKLRLESSQDMALNKTLSFPRTMLFSKQLRVLSSEQVNHDTKKITFALPGGDSEVSGLPPGAAILTQHTPAGAWIPVFRPYTPVHDLETPGILQLLVKRYPQGQASNYLHSLVAGDELTVRGPIPTFYKWKTSQAPRDVVFIAGGAGITPIYSLAKGVLENKSDNTTIHLLWGVNSSRDVLLKKEFGDLKALAGDSLKITYFVSGEKGLAEIDEAKKTTSVPAEFQPGRITESALNGLIKSVGGKEKLGDEQGMKVFLCGPPAMEEGLAGKNGILSQLGITKKEIHHF